ncbi:MAG: AtpZ/AtpI family protein, partial [Ilumatobacteraceae bacterium]
MKLLPTNSRASRSDNTVGRGMDVALTIGLFFGIGAALDHWLGTTPWFMIGLTIVASIGFFYSFKFQYTARMEQLEAERAERTRT